MERCLHVLGSVESNQRVSSDGLREDWQDDIHNYKCQDPSEIISTSPPLYCIISIVFVAQTYITESQLGGFSFFTNNSKFEFVQSAEFTLIYLNKWNL